MSMAPLSTDPARARRPAMVWPSVAVVALAVCVMVVPFRLASAGQAAFAGRTALVEVVSSGFVTLWSGDAGRVGVDLQRAVDFWARFHVLKALLAGLLLVAVAVLVLRTWQVGLAAGRARHRVALTAGLLIQLWVAALALVVLVANVQGAVAPMSSVLGLLPFGDADPSLAAALAQARQALETGHRSPATDLLVQDFTAYHAAMVGLGAATALALAGLASLMWRRRRGVPSVWGTRVLSGGAVLVVAAAACFALVTVANLGTAAHPEPALLGFLRGGL